MKIIIKKIIKKINLFGDNILSIILFLLYILILFFYKCFNKYKIKKGWLKVDKFDLDNKFFPF